MANEWDFMRSKKLSDWDYYIEQFAKKDKFHHLIGIHNGVQFYDHTNPHITHASIQEENTYKAKEYRNKYKKCCRIAVPLFQKRQSGWTGLSAGPLNSPDPPHRCERFHPIDA